jgi:hypothetical protein
MQSSARSPPSEVNVMPDRALMLFAELFPFCPTSGVFTASGQSAQADFVSTAPDFNPGDETFRSIGAQTGTNESKGISITERAVCSPF